MRVSKLKLFGDVFDNEKLLFPWRWMLVWCTSEGVVGQG